MHIIYIDDSFEKPFQTYAAIAIEVRNWRRAYEAIRDWRHSLSLSDGIKMTKEFHATEFVTGRGQLGNEIVTKYRRAQIFRHAFQFLDQQQGLSIFSACRSDNTAFAFERLITRIHRTMEAWDSFAILICDEGKEIEMTKTTRRLSVFNPVPVYSGGKPTSQNLATIRIIEDPFFKDSNRSYFIQMADFVAYGLLRREKHLASKNKYGIHECFDLLQNSVVRAASRNDPMGVIR